MANATQPRRSRTQTETTPVAAGADASFVVRSPIAGVIAGVSYTPAAALNGANTNSRTLQVVNKAQDGTGTAVVATLALVAGVTIAAFDEGNLNLSGTPANLNVAEGDILALQSIHVGTGIADPGGDFTVTYTG